MAAKSFALQQSYSDTHERHKDAMSVENKEQKLNSIAEIIIIITFQ